MMLECIKTLPVRVNASRALLEITLTSSGRSSVLNVQLGVTLAKEPRSVHVHSVPQGIFKITLGYSIAILVLLVRTRVRLVRSNV